MRTCSARNLFFIISIHASFSCEASAEIKDANIYPEVSLPQGNLRGINIVTNHKRVIHGFVGIPFAQPPIGNLRFSAPLPAAAWNGTLNATKDANMCPQVRRDRVAGEEDCLYLNVYTPKLPSTDSQPLPVMVWIYSGAFSRGSGDLTEEHPKYILDKDVILVVPNYRLGPLGFFSTGDEVSPGNYGLKDQVLALKWVQTNIQYFGGDPGKVTLFGLSSGSASTDLLILSDLAAGLFHKCIKMSGSSTSLRAYAPRNILVRDSYRLGEHLGCPNTTSTALVNCLRELNASQIADTTSLFLEWDKYPDIIWRPTDEPDAEGAFLTDSPANLYAAGKVRDISCISGLTADEGLYYTSRFYKNPDIFDEFLANVDDILPYILLYYDHEDVSAYTAAVKAFYLNDLTADREVLLANLTQLVGDVYYIYPTYSTHLKQFALGKSPQYLYSFEYLRTVKNDNDTMVAKGIKHADDEMFIYLLWCDEFELCELSEADSKMIDILVELWTSFASSGIPTQTWNEAVTWRRYSSEDNYLRIGDGSDLTLAEKHSYLTERMQFWDTLQHTLDSGKPDVPSYISNKDHCEASSEIKDANIYPEVSLPQGNLRGINIVTNHKRVIHGFVGIPFAQPPIGNLRFSAPLPAAAWNGTLNATRDANMCPQVLRGRVAGEEDCLYLNVYTPKLPSTDSKPLPVMVWIHGGAFSRGSGDSTNKNPKYILDKDVILVVPNYRLGPLGFFSTGDEVSPGNYGLKDQVLALKWVQTNIQYFGGDPGKVTLFGISAGAVSVDLLTLSDSATGLFHKCIKMSGSALSPRGYVPRAILARDSYLLGEHLGCPNTTSTALVNCLRGLNASQITNTTSLFLKWDMYPDMVWRPTHEPEAEGALLTESPANLYAVGKIRDLPCITGVVRDEGLYYTSRIYENPDLFNDFLDNIDDILPYILLYQEHENVSAHTAAVKAFYLNDLTADREVLLANLTQLIGDVYYIYPTYSANQRRFALLRSPQYLYSFEYLRTFKYNNDSVIHDGIQHVDDEFFIFPTSPSSCERGLSNCKMSEADFEMVDIMVGLWTSFAINGAPSLDFINDVTY